MCPYHRPAIGAYLLVLSSLLLPHLYVYTTLHIFSLFFLVV